MRVSRRVNAPSIRKFLEALDALCTALACVCIPRPWSAPWAGASAGGSAPSQGRRLARSLCRRGAQRLSGQSRRVPGPTPPAPGRRSAARPAPTRSAAGAVASTRPRSTLERQARRRCGRLQRHRGGRGRAGLTQELGADRPVGTGRHGKEGAGRSTAPGAVTTRPRPPAEGVSGRASPAICGYTDRGSRDRSDCRPPTCTPFSISNGIFLRRPRPDALGKRTSRSPRIRPSGPFSSRLSVAPTK